MILTWKVNWGRTKCDHVIRPGLWETCLRSSSLFFLQGLHVFTPLVVVLGYSLLLSLKRINQSVKQSVFSTQNTHISVCACLYLYVCVLGYFSKRNALLLEYQYMLLFDRVCGASSRHGLCCCTSPGKDTVRHGEMCSFPQKLLVPRRMGGGEASLCLWYDCSWSPACRLPDASQVTGQA